MWGDGGMSLHKYCGVYTGGGLNVSRILTSFSGCCVIRRDCAIGMADQDCMAIAGVTLLFGMAVCCGVCAINRTPPWCIIPCNTLIDPWGGFDGSLSHWIKGCHVCWCICDALQGDDRSIVYHPLLLHTHPLFHPLFHCCCRKR